MTTYTVTSMYDGRDHWSGEASDVFEAIALCHNHVGAEPPNSDTLTAYSSLPEIACQWFVRCDEPGNEHLSRWVASA